MRPFLWSYNISICTDFNFSRYQVQLQIYIDKCDAKFLAVSALDGVFRWQSTQTIVPSKVIPLELSVYWCRAHVDSHAIMRACRLCSLLSLILYKTKMRIRDLAIRLAGLMASCSWQSPHKCKKQITRLNKLCSCSVIALITIILVIVNGDNRVGPTRISGIISKSRD